jgi:outer membrane protein TolC
MKCFLVHGMVVALLLVHVGCQSMRKNTEIPEFPTPSGPSPVATGQTYLQPHSPDPPEAVQVEYFGPMSISDYNQVTHERITLQQCIELALSDSPVLRDLGVGIVRSPNSIITEMDPATAFSDPRFGEEAALSAFDANFVLNTSGQKNDRANNNRFLGNNLGMFAQDLIRQEAEINKTAVSGTRFAIRHGIEYDFNNQAGNRWNRENKQFSEAQRQIRGQRSSSWLTFIESEVRQPLLQGGGVNFNRIAGPNSQPGFYNGVLIARANTEISMARFEQGVRDLVSNVENAYWDLHFAYRDLEAAIEARDAAKAFYEESLKIEGITDSQTVPHVVDGKSIAAAGSLKVFSAKEQLQRFEAAVLLALEGQLTEGTRTDGGSTGGSFRSQGGVRLAERRLRYMIGKPQTEGQLLMPTDQPLDAMVFFDWNESVELALNRRAELRQQSWAVKQRQMELTASRNFLLPRLDLVALHRFRGLGGDLTGSNTYMDDLRADAVAPPGSDPSRKSAAFGDLLSGDFQEWQIGAELSVPLGFRQAHSAVRNAELRLQREKVLLREQQRSISLALANALGEVQRTYATMEIAFNRYQAAQEYKSRADQELENLGVTPDVPLEAQRRVLEAKQQFLRSQTEYMVALKNVHFERGTLLDYHQVFLSESASSALAITGAENRQLRQVPGNSNVRQDPAIAVKTDESRWQ